MYWLAAFSYYCAQRKFPQLMSDGDAQYYRIPSSHEKMAEEKFQKRMLWAGVVVVSILSVLSAIFNYYHQMDKKQNITDETVLTVQAVDKILITTVLAACTVLILLSVLRIKSQIEIFAAQKGKQCYLYLTLITVSVFGIDQVFDCIDKLTEKNPEV